VVDAVSLTDETVQIDVAGTLIDPADVVAIWE
jgi:hypothetical protein